MDKFTFWYIVVCTIITITILTSFYIEDVEIKKDKTFCESKELTFLSGGNHIQCINEDGEIKHYSRDMRRNLNQRSIE